MDMIERVGRAMLPALGYSSDCKWEQIWVGNIEENESLADMCRTAARAALAALNEPTEAMIAAGIDVRGPGMTFEQSTKAIWQAMIAAAGEG